VNTAEEVGKEIWDDIKGIFDGNKKGKGDGQVETNSSDTSASLNATVSSSNTTIPSRRRLI